MKAFAEFYVLEYIKHFKRSLFMDNKAPLLSSEIAGLWNAYQSDSSVICLFRHFLNNIDD
ncbi:MAG TPA: DUF3231 family protein, partial [Clostridia bacterium]